MLFLFTIQKCKQLVSWMVFAYTFEVEAIGM